MSKLLTVFMVWMLAMSVHAGNLKGSRASMAVQNWEAERSELSYIEDDASLERMVKGGYLVPIPDTVGITIDPRLDLKWRFVRPWVATFLHELGRDFYKEFREQLQINSAVRTVERQEELRRGNGNAAPPEGRRRSVHPTGAAIDIAKLGRTTAETAWLRKRLSQLETDDRVEATEERRQAVFHVMVFKSYTSKAPAAKKKKKPSR